MNLDLVKGLARGLTADVAGAPVDLMSQIANLGLAAGGYVGHKTGLLKQPWDLIEQPIGGSDWFAKNTILQDPGTAAYTAGRFTGNVAPLFPKIARSIPLQRDSSPNALVWHGSPHKFDKFDSSKIGTGEGAQAYGHGLYLAENPAVAREYQEKLSSVGGAKNLASQYGDVDKGITEAQRRISHYKQLIADGGGGDLRRANGMLNIAQKNLDDLTAMKAGLPENTGALYKVDLPDEHIAKMLDWDKPLSQQSAEVQKALNVQNSERYQQIQNELMDMMRNGGMDTPGWNALTSESMAIRQASGGFSPLNTGEDFYKGASATYGGHGGVSGYLKDRGIPGIRYLDGGSRGAGQGSSNFVVFPGNESLLQILERNGKGLAK